MTCPIFMHFEAREKLEIGMYSQITLKNAWRRVLGRFCFVFSFTILQI